jgi:hypothetical protein
MPLLGPGFGAFFFSQVDRSGADRTCEMVALGITNAKRRPPNGGLRVKDSGEKHRSR